MAARGSVGRGIRCRGVAGCVIRCFGAIGVVAYFLGVELWGKKEEEGQGGDSGALDISIHSEGREGGQLTLYSSRRTL